MIKQFFNFLSRIRPRPFIFFQRKLGIEEEWRLLKSNIGRHKLKFLLCSGILLIPLYPRISNFISQSVISGLDENLSEKANLTKAIESHLKRIVERVLKDKQIKREGGLFVESLAKQKLVQDSVVSLLARSVKDEEFISDAKTLTKILAHQILNDKEIEGDLVAIVSKIFKDPEVRLEATEAVKYVFGQQDVRENLIKMFKEAFEDPRLRQALQEALTVAFTEILLDNDISDKLKLFSYFLIEKETSRDGSIKAMADKILGNFFLLPSSKEKISEFEKIMKDDTDLISNLHDRKENSDKKDSKRTYFF